jgi:hypothetical protein
MAFYHTSNSYRFLRSEASGPNQTSLWETIVLDNKKGNKATWICILKYMIICAFENSPSIPNFLVTNIVYIGYDQLKKMTPFPFTFP